MFVGIVIPEIRRRVACMARQRGDHLRELKVKALISISESPAEVVEVGSRLLGAAFL